MTRKHLVRLALLGVLPVALVAVASPAWAYRFIQNTAVGRTSAGYLVSCSDPVGFTHWANASIPWRHNTAGKGAGKEAALQSSMASWNAVSPASHNLSYAGTTTAGWATDGINTMLWAKGNGCSGTCLALTALVLQAGQVIVETDITFNSRYAWNTNGSSYDVQAVATHELGHTLGLHHTEITGTPRPTMYAAYFGTDGRTLENDDKDGLNCSYNRYGP